VAGGSSPPPQGEAAALATSSTWRATCGFGLGVIAGWKQMLGQMVARNAEVSIGRFYDTMHYCDGTYTPSPILPPTCGLGKWTEAGTSQGIDFF